MISKKDLVFFIFPLSLSVIDSDKGFFIYIKCVLIKKYMFFLRVRAHVCACNIFTLLSSILCMHVQKGIYTY